MTELRLLLTKEQEATQSIPKLENGPASKHVKELLAGGYLIISGPDPNLRLQLKELLAHCLLTHSRQVEAHPICLQTQGAQRHELLRLIVLMQIDLVLVDAPQSQGVVHWNCCIKETKGWHP